MNKRCLTCGEKLSGRSDKKFCNQACRNDFHNGLKPRYDSLESRLLLSFRKNRNILTELIREGKQQAAIEDLRKKGFDPEAITGIRQKTDGQLVLCCYEYRLLTIGESILWSCEP